MRGEEVPASYFNGELQGVRPNDTALSSDGLTIYTAGDDGILRVYSAESGELLSQLKLGSNLGGMDVSPDGSFLLVVDLDPISSVVAYPWWDSTATVALYKVDLKTLQATTYTFEMTGELRAFFDVAVMEDGRAIISQQILDGWSGWAPIWSLDLNSGEISRHGTYRDGSPLWDTADGSTALLAIDDSSDAGLYTFDEFGTQVHEHELYWDGVSGFNVGVQAISAEAGLILQYLGSGQSYVKTWRSSSGIPCRKSKTAFRITSLPDSISVLTASRSISWTSTPTR